MTLDAARGILACPHCSEALVHVAGGLTCPRGHRFDTARQGYVNLLGAAQPANADTADMVAARDRFLGSGLYDPIADEVAGRVRDAATLLEVGAGTGFYLARALDRIPGARGIALDVSVAAARRAARAHPRLASVVGDAWGTLPVRTRRVGAVLSIFAPRNLPEFARVLGQRGVLVVVTPTASHLDSLRERYGLMSIQSDKDERLGRSVLGLFEPIGSRTLDYTRPVSADQVRDLIAMGPNAFHGVPDEVSDADLHVSVTVRWFRTSASG